MRITSAPNCAIVMPPSGAATKAENSTMRRSCSSRFIRGFPYRAVSRAADWRLCPRRPGRFVVAERHRRAGPVGRRLGKLHGRLQVLELADRGLALDRPARQLLRRELLRHVLQLDFGHLAPTDEPAPALR